MNHSHLNDQEKKVLAALFREGDSSISKLSKATLINRTTLYPMLDRLLGKGLVTKVQLEGNVIFRTISVAELSVWAKRKEQEAKIAAEDTVRWAKSQSQERLTSLRTEIKYYEGLDGVMSLYDDTWRQNTEKVIYALTDYEQAYKVVGDAFLRDDYFKRRIRHGVRVQSLLPDSVIGRRELKTAKELLRDMRFIDLFEHLGIELNIYDNKVAIFAFDKERPSGVLIQNDVIANAFKQIFRYLWKTAGKKVLNPN